MLAIISHQDRYSLNPALKVFKTDGYARPLGNQRITKHIALCCDDRQVTPEIIQHASSKREARLGIVKVRTYTGICIKQKIMAIVIVHPAKIKVNKLIDQPELGGQFDCSSTHIMLSNTGIWMLDPNEHEMHSCTFRNQAMDSLDGRQWIKPLIQPTSPYKNKIICGDIKG
ncbi:hypothetical protein CP336_17505 [Pseudomonas fluorescens]|nr:hypothetical protein CP336_17505 [Pseudomonas fluorescens]